MKILILLLFITINLSGKPYREQVAKGEQTDEITGTENEINHKLLEAAERGNVALIKKCIAEGADINFQVKMDKPGPHGMNFDGWNALTFSAIKCRIEATKYLIEKGADVNAVIGDWGSNLNIAMNGVSTNRKLYLPIEEQPISFAKLLIKKGADVNKSTKNGITPLMFASTTDKEELIIMLIDKGADINAKDNKGKTAIDYAEEKKQYKTIELLKSFLTKE